MLCCLSRVDIWAGWSRADYLHLTWASFESSAMDFFTVPKLTFVVLHCFFVIGHDGQRSWYQGSR